MSGDRHSVSRQSMSAAILRLEGVPGAVEKPAEDHHDLVERQRRRGQKFVERVNRWGRWFTWPAVIISPFLPIPNAIIYAVAGWTGMRLVTFLILDAIGTLSWAGMLAGLGYALGQHAVSVAQTVSKYGLWISIGIVVLVIAGQMRGARSQR